MSGAPSRPFLRRLFRGLLLSGGALALVFWSWPSQGQTNDECLLCHVQKDSDAPYVDMDAFSQSIHGRQQCLSCHVDAVGFPHAEKLAPVSCARCHRVEAQIYLNSDHGRAVAKGKVEAASCKDCHGHGHNLLNARNPASPVFRKNIPATCGQCHAGENRPANKDLTERHPVETYWGTVHGQAVLNDRLNAAVCSDCHGSHDLHGSSNPQSRVHRSRIVNTCGRCHDNVALVFQESIHGKAASLGIKESPVCTDCHGEHSIRPASDPGSSVSPQGITRTCSECHESERLINKFGLPRNRLKSYLDSYHGLAAQRGDLGVANCSSCHGWHDVLPASDPRSSINKANLPNTCSRCHSGIQKKFMSGRIHSDAKFSPQFWVLFFRWFYLLLIPLVVGGLALHNLLDFSHKVVHKPEEPSALELTILRLNVMERWQHAALALTFGLLAYSGLALEFPKAWWAVPFQWMGGEPSRKILHRSMALVFILTGVWHGLYLLITRRGRFILKHRLWPRLRDVPDALAMVRYNLGLSPVKPVLPYPSYIERAEYWALVWGALVMVVTGGLLYFNDFTLQHFPLWVSDVARIVHYFEAVLACLALLAWHAYWTVFDPAVYPMNWAWLTGRLRRGAGKKK